MIFEVTSAINIGNYYYHFLFWERVTKMQEAILYNEEFNTKISGFTYIKHKYHNLSKRQIWNSIHKAFTSLSDSILFPYYSILFTLRTRTGGFLLAPLPPPLQPLLSADIINHINYVPGFRFMFYCALLEQLERLCGLIFMTCCF